ncbi:MAG TPA: class I SAM-dependent methyltransferase [Ardenticatenaceae bacterium]|nr:class I SAM-dependent methyltransferase [Ardenticatenaceae bacterium]
MATGTPRGEGGILPVEGIARRYQAAYSDARAYDRIFFKDEDSRRFNAAEGTTIHRLLGLPAGRSVLDVGAGTGRIGAYLASQGLRVTALDLSEAMLREIQAKARAADLAALRYVRASAGEPPFAPASFDGVISTRFFHLFPVRVYRGFLLKLWPLLRPGGVLLIQFNSALALGPATWVRELYWQRVRGHPHSYLWPGQVTQIFEGFADVSVHGFSPVGLRFVRRLHASSAVALERFVAEGQRSFLASRVFVRAVKPAGN